MLITICLILGTAFGKINEIDMFILFLTVMGDIAISYNVFNKEKLE